MDGTILNKKYDLVERVKALEEGGGDDKAVVKYAFSVPSAPTLRVSRYINGVYIGYSDYAYNPYNHQTIDEKMELIPSYGGDKFGCKLLVDGIDHEKDYIFEVNPYSTSTTAEESFYL